jgi:hypothetical protein
MTTITLELPEDIAVKAKEAGLLTPERLAGMLDDALLRQKEVVATQKRYRLADVLDSFPSSEECPLVDFGSPRGEEAW